jgi:hypothetical protein
MLTKHIKETHCHISNVILNLETKTKKDLNSWTSWLLYSIMKDQQPIRFQKMLQDNTLIPFLNKNISVYNCQMQKIIVVNEKEEYEAKEILWRELLTAVGL